MTEADVRAAIEAAETRQPQRVPQPDLSARPSNGQGGPAGHRLPLRYFDAIVPFDRGGDLIDGLLQPGALGLIVGASGTRKTFLALDMALAVARGLLWFGRQAHQGPVVYVAAEAGQSFANRVVAYRIHHGLDDAALPFADISIALDLRAEHGDIEALIHSINEASEYFEGSVALVLVDTVAAVTPGGDENSSADMGRLIANLMRLRDSTGAAVVGVHHLGKDASRGARGHSSLFAAMDTVLSVEADDVSPFSIAKVSKQRDLEGAGEFAFGLDVIEIGQRTNGMPLASCVVRPVDEVVRSSRTKLPPTLRRAIAALSDLLVDHGRPAPDAKHYPAGAVVVSVEQWREHLTMAGIINRDARNTRSAWKKIHDGLAERGAVGEWNDLVWIVKK